MAPVAILAGLATLLWGNEIWEDQEAKVGDLSLSVDAGLDTNENLIEDVERDLARLADRVNSGVLGTCFLLFFIRQALNA